MVPKTIASAASDRNRFRGYQGGVIAMHRALASFVLEPLDFLLSGVLVLLFSLIWLAFLPATCRLWQSAFEIGVKALALNAQIGLREHHFASYLRFVIPYPRMDALAPNAEIWWLTTAAVLMIFFASLLLPKKLLPLIYFLRVVLFIQASALAYFALVPNRFPHTPDSYMEGLVTYGIALISFVPVLFGLTYYIFDFGLIRKALLTALAMIHLSLFFPLQVLLQAFVLNKTVLFMPVLYIVLGIPIDVLIIIAFYSWGMSWQAKTKGAAQTP